MARKKRVTSTDINQPNQPNQPETVRLRVNVKLNPEQKHAYKIIKDNTITFLNGRAGSGKANANSELILTTDGWKCMGDIQKGDFVFSENGLPIEVLSIHPQGIKDIYKVMFSDGTWSRCTMDHLWYTSTCKERDYHKAGKVRSTLEIAESLKYGKGNKRNHSIPITKPVNFDKKQLKINPLCFRCAYR